MNIEKIYIKNFGPFKEEEIIFQPGYINLIAGENASGKTQLVGSIMYIVNGKKVLKVYAKGDSEPSAVEVVISDNYLKHKISRKMRQNKFYLDYSSEIQTKMNLKDVDLKSSSAKKFNPFIISSENSNLRNISIDVNGLDALEKILIGNESSLAFLKELKNLLKRNSYDKNKIFTYSYGQHMIIYYVNFILNFLKHEEKQPIILDSILSNLSSEASMFLLSIFEVIAKTNQVILLNHTNYNYTKNLKEYSVKVVKKLTYSGSVIRKISYNYYSEDFIVAPLANNTEKTEVTFQYVKNKLLDKEENRYFEFKEVKGNNPVNSIISIIDQYVVAFLNDTKVKKGQIIWGITDIDGKVVGVNLDSKQRDKLRREISEKLSKISPTIPQSSYEVNIINVVDNDNNLVENLFVVEVSINYLKSNFLYSTASGEIYIKTDGGKKKLNMLEIQKELLFRNGLKIKNL